MVLATKAERDILFQFTVDDVGEDFEFTMPVRTEAFARRDTIFIHDPKGSEGVPFRILPPG
jgi:hypothetical protein